METFQQYFDQLKTYVASWYAGIKADANSLMATDDIFAVTGEVLLGVVFALIILALLSPIFAGLLGLKNDPQRPGKLALLTEVRPGQTKAKMRQGKFIGFIHDKGPEFTLYKLLNPWYWFDVYAWVFGYRVIGIPPFQFLETYDLPRLDKQEDVVDGREVSEFFRKEDKSDHVRTLPFPFFFMVSGAEIQTVPFTIKGSIQAQVEREDEREYNAFFNTTSWGVFLNQNLTAVIRSVVRSSVTLDDAIGSTQKDIWAKEVAADTSAYEKVSREILEQLRIRRFTFGDQDEKTIYDMIGLKILSVEIIDFDPELTAEEAMEIRAAIRGRQTGRGRALEGQGEAGFQEKVLEVASEKGEHGHTSMLAESIVRASKGGNLDALLSAFLKNIVVPDRR